MSPPRDAATRRRAYRLGLEAETIAIWRLRLSGWRILARRYKCPVGEIDIVARRRNVVAIVEVKARAARDQALESVSAKQRARIARAAEHFRAHRPDLHDCAIRFDLIVLTPRAWPYWLKDAWRM